MSSRARAQQQYLQQSIQTAAAKMSGPINKVAFKAATNIPAPSHRRTRKTIQKIVIPSLEATDLTRATQSLRRQAVLKKIKECSVIGGIEYKNICYFSQK